MFLAVTSGFLNAGAKGTMMRHVMEERGSELQELAECGF